ncbi:MAG TPA: hypothetical protein VI818_02680 [Candidatus Thermoplasmatota archaeon]|nr:hypothetical protein [Candidatus Thermoplasmatota archaeon]
MRTVLALLLAAFAGCYGPGLEESTMDCDALPTGPNGFSLLVENPGRLVGRCVALRRNQVGDTTVVLSKLSENGTAFLPVKEIGRYSLTVAVRPVGDKYCVHDVSEHVDHPGTGVIDVRARPGMVCA